MRKLAIWFLTLCLTSSFMGYAQEIVSFKLTPEATFLSNDGEDFIIVPYEGKSAHEIFQLLATNAASVFNDPSKVMSTVEDKSIKFRSIIPVAQKEVKLLNQRTLAESKGFLQLEIRIKDGRIRISAPFVENDIWIDGSPMQGNFQNLVSQWYKPEKKEKKRIENENFRNSLESRVNLIVNSIIGSTPQMEEDDDW